jgi:CHAD domain-containing protein
MGDKPALRPRAAIGPALHAVAAHMLAQARAALTDVERSNQAAIHDFRRAMKQWRALLRLLRPFIDDAARWRGEARDRARALAGARDGQSALNAFDDLVDQGVALPARSIATMRSRLDAIRASEEQAVLTPAMRQDILEWLDLAEAAVERWPLDTIGFDMLAERLASGYRVARRLVPADWSNADADVMHELRRRVVDHRYQAELVEALWPRFSRMWLDEAERLRDRLGKCQDLEVLERLTDPHRPLARWRARLVPFCRERKGDLAQRAARVATRLFAERPKAYRRRLEALWEQGR